MDILVKMDRFQIKQNALNVKSILITGMTKTLFEISTPAVLNMLTNWKLSSQKLDPYSKTF